MSDEAHCLFCRIIRREIPAAVVYEDENVLAFNDIAPQAPFHILIIPKKHIATPDDFTIKDKQIAGELFLAAGQIAREKGFADDGYRLNMNCRAMGGQTVFHVHLHLLGGRHFHWPPG